MRAYNKIFIQTGPAASQRGWGDLVRSANTAGIPVGCAASDVVPPDIQSDARNRGNFIATADTNGARFDFDYTVYASEEQARRAWQQHAVGRWALYRARIPRDLDPAVCALSIENEQRGTAGWESDGAIPGFTGWADCIGWQAYYTALEVLKADRPWRYFAFAFSGGNPAPGAWDQPGMLAYLRLCAENPTRLGVALHEYSFHDDLFDGVTWGSKPADARGTKVFRFRDLFDACARHGIARPAVQIKEFGWHERHLPADTAAVRVQLLQAAEVYAQWPEIELVALWTAQRGWGTIHQQVEALIPYLQEMTLQHAWEISDPTPPPPEPPQEPVYTAVADLLPPGASDAEKDAIWQNVKARSGSVTHSADDAGKMVRGGKPGSHVNVWEPQRWSGDIMAYLRDVYSVEGRPAFLDTPEPPEPPDPPPGTIPQDRRDMPLLVDISRHQGRQVRPGEYAADTIDFERMRREAGVKGVIIRASYGHKADELYYAWVPQVLGSQLPHGNYHFLNPGTAVGQARQFLQTRIPGRLLDWVDIERNEETGKEPSAADVRAFCDEYYRLTGLHVGIYTAPAVWRRIWGSDPSILEGGKRRLWIANHDTVRDDGTVVELPRPSIPLPWLQSEWGQTNARITFWQFGAYMKLPGYARVIDTNVFHGDQAMLDAFLDEHKPTEPRPEVLIGLHATADGGEYAPRDLAQFDILQPGVIKVMTSHSSTAVRTLAQRHPQAEFIVRAFLDFGGRAVTPAQFLQWTRDDVARLMQVLGSNRMIVELHNEPNLVPEGLGASWANGRAFNTWFLELLRLYRASFPMLRFMFPGLSPGGTINGIREDSTLFFSSCLDAARASDAVGIHAYWAANYPMSKALQHVANTAQIVPGRPCWVTEASNNCADTPPAAKGAEYAQFWRRLADVPNVRGVTYFVASASNPAWSWSGGTGETWVDADMAQHVRAAMG